MSSENQKLKLDIMADRDRLQAENEALRARVTELEAHHRELRKQLADANRGAERNAKINRSLAGQLVEVRKQLAARDEALRPFAECTNEIRITHNNVKQEFYNFMPTEHCRNARAVLKGTV